MKTKKTLKKELRLVESLIKKDFVKEKTISDLYDHVFKSKGKKIRAKLNLISSSQNKKINKNHRIKLAAIIELLHTATLVHDDVVDNSPTRRGIKSVNNIWTNAHGVLIGDYIYSKAFMYMVDIGNKKILKELSNATNDISQGELIQLDAMNNFEITLNKLKKISYYKTGRLFEASAKTGALLINANDTYINSISNCNCKSNHHCLLTISGAKMYLWSFTGLPSRSRTTCSFRTQKVVTMISSLFISCVWNPE